MFYFGGRRNFGYGRALSYAGFNALRAAHLGGHHGTTATHGHRWRHFAAFCHQNGINDAREITRETLILFAENLRDRVSMGEMAAAYAQNLVSTVNITLRALTADRGIWVPPRSVGDRQRIRTTPPSGYDPATVCGAAQTLREKHHYRIAALVGLARHIGLRKREAALLDLVDARAEADCLSAVDIRRGTKGGRGRQVPRWVPLDLDGHRCLEHAAEAAGESRCLVPDGMSLAQFLRHANYIAKPIFQAAGIRSFQDLRSSYACQRYEALTGQVAPVFSCPSLVPQIEDLAARRVISQELGHGRIDVVASYVGAWR